MPRKANFLKFFDRDNFTYFQELVKQKVRPGKKKVNNRNLMFFEDVNYHIV